MKKVFSIKYLVFSIKTLAVASILYTLYSILNTGALAQVSIPLTVIPARNQVEVEPGEKTALTINFYNQSDDPISGFFQVSDFIVEDDKGTPKLIENQDETPLKYSAANWFKLFYNQATLPPQNKVSLQATITVPPDARPGGHYVAIFFESTEALKESGTGISPRIASLIYVKVKGNISEQAFISKFLAPTFLEYGPIKIQASVLNRGDLHIKPRGIINLTDMLNRLVDQQSFDEQNVFPDATRSFENNLGSKWLFGRYKINLDLSYGEKSQALTASTYVWVFPWRTTLIILLAIIIFYTVVTNFYKSFIVKESS